MLDFRLLLGDSEIVIDQFIFSSNSIGPIGFYQGLQSNFQIGGGGGGGHILVTQYWEGGTSHFKSLKLSGATCAFHPLLTHTLPIFQKEKI